MNFPRLPLVQKWNTVMFKQQFIQEQVYKQEWIACLCHFTHAASFQIRNINFSCYIFHILERYCDQHL